MTNRLRFTIPLAIAALSTLTFWSTSPARGADEAQPATAAPTTDAPARSEAPNTAQGEVAAADKQESAQQEEKQVELRKVVVAEDRIELMVPKVWQERERQNNIIEREFVIYEKPLEEGAEVTEKTPSGRLTLSASGGTVDQNMKRWIGQFRLGHDADGKDDVQQEEIELQGGTLHLLDISGTYFDAPRGPFGPKVERPDYRMLGAIIQIDNGPLYFVKFYGPEKVVAAHAKQFGRMVREGKIVAPAADQAESDSQADQQKADR